MLANFKTQVAQEAMHKYYKTVPLADVIFSPSVRVLSETNLYKQAYNLACKTFAVAPQKKVGRPSFRHDHLREQANDIPKFWIEDDNPCEL
jgi:hypothetical protein